MARKEGGGIKVGGLRIGCGWIFLLLIGLTFGLYRWQPGIFRAAGERVGPVIARWVPAAGRWLKRTSTPPTPAPTPATPVPTPSPAATPMPEASPTPEPTPAPEATPESQPTAEPEAGPTPSGETPETTDLVIGGGAEARPGKTVLVRIAGKPPVTLMLGAGEAPAGLEDGIVGMRAGGTRRIVFSDGARSSRFPPGGAARVAPDTAGESEVELVEVW